MPPIYYQFVTLNFDRPQSVFHLPRWHWPGMGPYNGFSGAARIRGWQLLRFYQSNGWLAYQDVCSVTGTAGSTQLHNEDYLRPYNAYPVSRRAHAAIHARVRFPKAWARFLRDEALSDTWARGLNAKPVPSALRSGCPVSEVIELAQHPEWLVVQQHEFYDG